MRTFIAIPLTPAVREVLMEAQTKLRSFGADVRWTAIPSIHLTIKFLGEIDPDILPSLAGRLKAATETEIPFSLCLAGLGGFPNLRDPRVLWCGMKGEIPMLQSLREKVETICSEGGFEREDRPFQSHLTLGRVRGKTKLQPLLDYIKITPVRELAFTVRDFNIYRSVLQPQGALYTMLHTIELKGGGRP